MTAAELIASALRKIGAIASGETPTGNEYIDGLEALNDILDSWSTEGLTVHAIRSQSFTIPAGSTFTIGPGGDLDGVRPIRIIKANLGEIGLDVISVFDDKENSLFYDSSVPLGSITIRPDTGGVLEITSEQQFTPLTEPDQELVLPPGYQRALRYALAVDLAAEYERPLNAEVIQIAVASKADIKRVNNKTPLMEFDPIFLCNTQCSSLYRS